MDNLLKIYPQTIGLINISVAGVLFLNLFKIEKILIFGHMNKVLLGFIFLLSGILFLLHNKYGWILGYCCWLILAFIFIPLAFRAPLRGDLTTTIIDSENVIRTFCRYSLGIILISLLILSLEPVRNLFDMSVKELGLSFLLAVLLFHFL